MIKKLFFFMWFLYLLSMLQISFIHGLVYILLLLGGLIKLFFNSSISKDYLLKNGFDFGKFTSYIINSIQMILFYLFNFLNIKLPFIAFTLESDMLILTKEKNNDLENRRYHYSKKKKNTYFSLKLNRDVSMDEENFLDILNIKKKKNWDIDITKFSLWYQNLKIKKWTLFNFDENLSGDLGNTVLEIRNARLLKKYFLYNYDIKGYRKYSIIENKLYKDYNLEKNRLPKKIVYNIEINKSIKWVSSYLFRFVVTGNEYSKTLIKIKRTSVRRKISLTENGNEKIKELDNLFIKLNDLYNLHGIDGYNIELELK